MELKLVKNEEKYYEFIRVLRNDPDNQRGFLEQVNITEEQQFNYMKKHSDSYFICLLDEVPIGYVGVIDNDIRMCTASTYKNSGAGTFMLSEIIKLFPNASAKVLKSNAACLNVVKKCNFTIVNSDENLYYLNHGI